MFKESLLTYMLIGFEYFSILKMLLLGIVLSFHSETVPQTEGMCREAHCPMLQQWLGAKAVLGVQEIKTDLE